MQQLETLSLKPGTILCIFATQTALSSRFIGKESPGNTGHRTS